MPATARAAILFALAAPLWGCGRLHNPDLSTGSVSGRIAGAVPGARAYVLGHADVAAPVAADGTFRLDGVPEGNQYLVLFDGNAGAELLEVDVAGADVTNVAIDRPLAPAGSILAAGNPLRGTLATGLTFGVDGTPLQGVAAAPSATLFPLPAGRFTLRATQPGFKDTAALVRVVGGQSVPVELQLDADNDGGAWGCSWSGCASGLFCNPADGHCYLCVTDADCPGGTCTSDHVCKSTAVGSGPFCSACASGADCSGGACATVNEHGATTPGYCTGPSCQSGTKYSNGMCLVALSCLSYAATFGSTCLVNDACEAALDGGTCYRPSGVPSTALGTCTASCQSNPAGCPAGFQCDSTGGSFCRKACAASSDCPQGLACGTDGFCR